MGWLSRKFKQAGAWIAKTYNTVSAKVTEVAADVSSYFVKPETEEKLRTSAENFREKREKWDNRLRELKIEDKFVKGGGSEPEKPDIKKIERVQDYFKTKYATRSASDTFRGMTQVQRCEEMEVIAHDISKVLGIKKEPEVVFVTDNKSSFGSYCHDDNTLSLNVTNVGCNDPRLYVEQISTVVHEMVHALQFQVMLSDDHHGYSEELVKSWRLNALPENYIHPWESDYLYRTQPLEAWAFGYEKAIRKHLK